MREVSGTEKYDRECNFTVAFLFCFACFRSVTVGKSVGRVGVLVDFSEM